VTCASGISLLTFLDGRGIGLAPIFRAWRGLEDNKRDVKVGDVAKEYDKTTCEAVKTVDQRRIDSWE
jgi:hypothetical protein